VRLARHFIVHGRVQGVGFRYFACEAALREGLHGVAGNLPDGTVEVIAEGEAEAMERFERKLREGPRASRVDRVDTTEMEIGAYQSGFSIR
jgi:acylphosphatase